MSQFAKVFESGASIRRKYLLRKNAPKPAKTDSESDEEEEKLEEMFDMSVFYEEEEAPTAESVSNECSVLESFSYKNF